MALQYCTSLLTQLIGPQSTNQLLSYRLADNTPILTGNQPAFLYETISLTRAYSSDPDGLFGFLSELFQRQWFDHKSILFNYPTIISYRNRPAVELSNFRVPQEAAEGAFTCSRCKKKETTSFAKQVRSADEPMTIKIRCNNCGHQWIE